MSKPTITYQRPTHSVDINKSIYFDDYTEYVKNKDTQDYAAAVVGSYIEEASNQQREAINELGNKVGLGLDYLRNETAHQKQELAIINRNLKLSLDQQRSINLNLEKIQYLIALPDAEKVRIRHIELGLKYYSNAETNDAFYDDAIREFEKALELRPEDYFVLYKLGYIYLYAPNHIDINKSIQYFEKCIKYSVIEADQVAKEIYSKYLQNVRETHDVGKYVKSNALNESAFAHYILGDDPKAYHLQKEAYETLPNAERLFYAIKYGSKCDMVEEAGTFLNEASNQYPSVLYICLFDLDILTNKTLTKKLDKFISDYVKQVLGNRDKFKELFGLLPKDIVDDYDGSIESFDEKIFFQTHYQSFVNKAEDCLENAISTLKEHQKFVNKINDLYFLNLKLKDDLLNKLNQLIYDIQKKNVLLSETSKHLDVIKSDLDDYEGNIFYKSGDLHPLGLVVSSHRVGYGGPANDKFYVLGDEVIGYAPIRGTFSSDADKLLSNYEKLGVEGWDIPKLEVAFAASRTLGGRNSLGFKHHLNDKYYDNLRKIISGKGYIWFKSNSYTYFVIADMNSNSKKGLRMDDAYDADISEKVCAKDLRGKRSFSVYIPYRHEKMGVLPYKVIKNYEAYEVLSIIKNKGEEKVAHGIVDATDSISDLKETKAEKTEPETVKEIRDEIETTVSARNVALVIVAICLIRVLGLFSFGWTWIWYVVLVFFALMIINFQRDLKKYKRKLEELMNDRSDSKNQFDHIKSFIDKNWDAILSMDFPLVNIERKGEILFQIVDCNSMDLVEEKGKYLGIHVAFDPTDRNSSSLEENMKNSQLSTKFSHERTEDGISIYTKCYSEHKKELIADVKLIITEVFEQDLLEITLTMDE